MTLNFTPDGKLSFPTRLSFDSVGTTDAMYALAAPDTYPIADFDRAVGFLVAAIDSGRIRAAHSGMSSVSDEVGQPGTGMGRAKGQRSTSRSRSQGAARTREPG